MTETADAIREFTIGSTWYRVTDAGWAKVAKSPKGLPLSRSLPVVPTLRDPKVVPDRSLDAYVARLQRVIRPMDHRTQSAIGGRVGAFEIRATDGHRALVVPAQGDDPEKRSYPKLATVGRYWFQVVPEFVLALKRVAIYANPRMPTVQIKVSAERDGARVQLKASYDGDSASEWLVVPGAPGKTSCTFGVNARYLLDGCGLFPMRLYFSDGEEQLVLRLETLRDTLKRQLGQCAGQASDEDSFRYLLMPVRLERAVEVPDPPVEPPAPVPEAPPPALTISYGSTIIHRTGADSAATTASPPPADPGRVLRWRYRWTERATQAVVEGEAEAANEKAARAATGDSTGCSGCRTGRRWRRSREGKGGRR